MLDCVGITEYTKPLTIIIWPVLVGGGHGVALVVHVHHRLREEVVEVRHLEPLRK
jgi:hypothetical protein